jgi:AraC-like DNA-binding protein
MYREIIDNGRDSCSSVVYIHQVGSEVCESGHSFGPAIRDHYLIHSILDGEGTFYVGKRQDRLKKGEGFLIVPGVVTFYQADQGHPWTYCWVGFNGTDAKNICSQCGISMENPTFRFSDTEKMKECIRGLSSNYGANSNGFLTLAKLYEFFSMLQRKDMDLKKGAGIIDLAVDYISKNYSYGITVSQIADHLGISRSHLFRIFKESMGQSVQEYLLSFRLDRAEVLMEKTDMNIKEIMYSCGFNDMPNFSRQFRKAFGMPPGTYRKQK